MKRGVVGALCCVAFLTLPGPAKSEAVHLNLVNRSGLALTAVTAVPTGVAETQLQNLLTAAIPAEADIEATVIIEAPDETCLFDLTLTFASGSVTSRPDTDICQLDALIVE